MPSQGSHIQLGAHPHDVDALEAEPVVEAEELAGVPRQAGEVLDQDGVKPGRGDAGRGHELGPAELDLVLDRGGRLEITGVPEPPGSGRFGRAGQELSHNLFSQLLQPVSDLVLESSPIIGGPYRQGVSLSASGREWDVL